MLAASLPGLPANAQDCRAMLKPVDYIAFSGASKGKVEQILFIEAKTGQQRLSSVQRAIKAAVEQGAVTLRVANHLLPTE
jgi:predicted Holliday junction resolvase-like endonuclease